MLASGTIVAGYRIDGVLGQGGMGVVYRATQLSLNRVVALKLLSPELGDDPGFRTRFQREGQLQAGLDHQHIVTVYEAGQAEQGLFLAIRLIDGPTLKDLISNGQLDPRRSLRILAQVAQALDAAHDAGLIHRDIKPQNILIGKGDHAYLADFGLIKAPDEAALTGTGQFIGTIDYVAPEQIQGEPASAASDCYALTAVLYECLTGEVPFPRPNEAATVHAHIMAPPPLVSARRPDMPPAIDELITRGMAKEPGERPSSATELIRQAALALASGSPHVGVAGQETRITQPTDGDGRGKTTQARIMGEPVPAPSVSAAGAALAAPAPVTLPGPADATRRTDVADAPAAVDGPGPTPAASPETVRPAPARERPGTRSPAAVALVAALTVAVIAAGFLVGHSGASGGTAGSPSFASVGRLQLRYPSTWLLSSTTAPTVPGIAFDNPVVLSARTSGGALDAGEVLDAAGPTLLPASFRSRVLGILPAGQPVRLGNLEAYRYAGLQVRGLTGAVTVFAVPSTAGVATIACWSSTQPATAFLNQCGQVAATLQLSGAKGYPLGPSAAYARALSTSFDRLRTAASAALAQLQAASTPSAQAAAARRAGQAYGAAATELGQATVPPMVGDVQSAIVGDLRRLAGAYSSAAAAAQSNDGAAYRAATRLVRASSDALGKALQSLAGRGYTVGGR